jgi:hypothetical protein
MTTHPLIPAGWELSPPAPPAHARAAARTPEAGEFLAYGGADFSSTHDAAGHLFFAAFAKPPNGEYAFYIFKDGQPLPLSPRPVGRGQIQPEFRMVGGALHIVYTYIAGTNGVPMGGDVPSFAPIVVPLGGGGAARPPVVIPADSAAWQVWDGQYASDAEVMSPPARLFGRLNIIKNAYLALLGALVKSGAIVKG